LQAFFFLSASMSDDDLSRKPLGPAASTNLTDSCQVYQFKEVHAGPISFKGARLVGEAAYDRFEASLLRIVQTLADQGAVAIGQGQAVQVSPNTEAEASEPLLLSAAIEARLVEMRQSKTDGKNIRDTRTTLKLFLGVVGDKPVNTISKADTQIFFDALRWLPKNAGVRKDCRGLTVPELLALGEAEKTEEPSAYTYKNHMSRINALFNGLDSEGAVLRNPARKVGQHVNLASVVKVRRPFSLLELKTMFDPDRFTAWATRPDRWWIPMLCFYTGARVNEISQVKKNDIIYIGGHPCLSLRVTPDADESNLTLTKALQKLKTSSSRRVIPIAQPLIDAGFMDYVSDLSLIRHDRLFPHLRARTVVIEGADSVIGYGEAIGRSFSAYLKAEAGTPKGVVFHAFRHFFATYLSQKSVPRLDIAVITGHAEDHEVQALVDYYLTDDVPSQVTSMIRTLSLFTPAVDLPKYKRGQFDALLLSGKDFHP
jgi:integrase